LNRLVAFGFRCAHEEGMDTILAIETSTAHGSVARYEEGRPVEVIEFTSDRSHNSVIFEPLRVVLKAGPPDLIVVGTGPGSYSGIRVGIAAALGISLAHQVPLIGLPSLTAVGEAYGLERYAVTGDARRGAWWYAEVESGWLTLPPVVEDEAAIAARTAGWPGQLITLDAVSPPFCQARAVQPRADVLACRAGGLTVEAVARLAELETEPLYLRAPFITVSKKAQRWLVSRQAIP
jgi:tRNA threonylcarbamoyl adenosine modification protein YeaZ